MRNEMGLLLPGRIPTFVQSMADDETTTVPIHEGRVFGLRFER